jgi:sigma-B regulation protein RsbU (phosphoserine phosphatase)
MKNCIQHDLKILIVDDEEKILQALSRELLFLLEEKKLSLLTEPSATKALETLTLEHKNIAIIISDQRMPVMNGSTFLLKVKELYPDIISIVLTAYTDIEEMPKMIKAGIFSFIIKPWDKHFLLTEITKALEVYHLRKEKQQHLEMINEELKWGGELQRTLLRRELPGSNQVSFAVTYYPLQSLHCGGDYYDIMMLEEGLYLILIGDVAGHGIKGALVTAILKSIIYSGYVGKHKNSQFSPADFLGWLNRQVCIELKRIPNILITFSASCINLKEKTLTFSKAGHLPLILTRGTEVIKIDVQGAGMGFSPSMEYQNSLIPLQSLDTLYLFTDGLVESNSLNTQSNFLNLETLFLTKTSGQPAHEEILKRAQRKITGQQFKDDITLISANIK